MRWRRRQLLSFGCACCFSGGSLASTLASTSPPDGSWTAPGRLVRPDSASDEGGLWALMDREETRTRRSPFIVREAALRAYLVELACRLAGDHCQDLRVYTVRNPWFNAMMAPNGMMQVWTGLLLRVENEAQLAAVLGHEIGHYVQRHSLARLQDAKSRSAFMALMVPLGAIGLIGQMAALAGSAAYSRDHEREADRISLYLMKQAGYDLPSAARVWENLRKELQAGPGGDPAKRSVMFASHPPTDERQSELELMAAGLAASAGRLGVEEFQSRIEPLLPMLVDDELRRAQYDESIALFTRLIDQRPDRAILWAARGDARRLRHQSEDLDAALLDFDEALRRISPPPMAHRGRALTLRKQGRMKDAAESLQSYLQAQPDAPDAPLLKSYLDELKS